MKLKLRNWIYLFISIAAFPWNAFAFAEIEPRPMAYDSRIASYVYRPDSVYKYTGYYEFQSHIKFEVGEAIKTISMGDTTGWEIITSSNRLFLKPKSTRAKTNMTLITNKRLYHFDLDAAHAKSIYQEGLIIEARFIYPSKESQIELLGEENQDVPDLKHPEKYNFNYTFSGPDIIAPVKVFDDGQFTFFEFSRNNSKLPAIFQVDTEGYEGLVNFRVVGDYIVVESLSALYTLRHGTNTVCVFNEELMPDHD
ncbi:MAG: TrbG/VirB9 family P-type conjugative transfer protein [Rickettsiales bacterium]|jgi:type IV secretion system protein VirB9|nr:TrbG/VirB9 family P-type conjugative transfer protein [Rickettsiales bacterium]